MKDSKGNEYRQFDWIRVTKIKDRFRINAISDNGKVKQGPELTEQHISELIKAVLELKDPSI
jgi:hypothetical protein